MERRIISLVITTLMLVVCLPATPLASETVVFNDDAGRTVEVPVDINRIAISGPFAQMVIFALAPERLVGLSSRWDNEAEEFMGSYKDLPVLGQLYGTGGNMNLEELAVADPQIIIDLGEPKETIVEDMDVISEQTGIPTVHIGASLKTIPDAFRKLGVLLNLEERAEVLAAYCEDSYARAEAIMETVGEQSKTSILYLVTESGQNVIAKGSFHAELLDMICDNLAVVDTPSGKGTGNEASMEQIILWDPEVIIFAPDSVYAEAADSALWQELSAIAEGRYIEVPYGPYNWMGFPPSVQRYLGLLWLPSVLYPEACDYDLYEEVAKYYDLFYHYELSEERFNILTENSELAE